MCNETSISMMNMGKGPAETHENTEVDSGNTTELDKQRLAKVWLKRINDYLNESLSNPVAEEAVLGATNSSLMKIVVRLNEAIEKVLAESSEPFEHLDTLLRATDALYKVTRQIERYSRFKHLLTEARHALGALKDRQ